MENAHNQVLWTRKADSSRSSIFTTGRQQLQGAELFWLPGSSQRAKLPNTNGWGFAVRRDSYAAGVGFDVFQWVLLRMNPLGQKRTGRIGGSQRAIDDPSPCGDIGSA